MNEIAMEKKKDGEEKVERKDLKGFEIEINELGEIVSSLPIDKINKFLDKNVDDKKLKDRDLSEEE